MRSLVLDVDAVSFATGLTLIPSLEVLVEILPDKARVERSVYTEMFRAGLGSLVTDWQKRGLLGDPLDYRKVADAETTYRRFSKKSWKGLSRQDRASLAIAYAFSPAGLLTRDNLLSEAANQAGIFPVDLFDLIRFGIKLGTLNDAQARKICDLWDTNKYRAGRPANYAGNFEAEVRVRDQSKPLPF